MPTLLFLNLKGGVAKTTTAVAVAECLAGRAAQRGGKVLVIDADHQCAASELLLGEARVLGAEKSKRTLHDLMAAMLKDDFDGHAGTFARYLAPEATRIRSVKGAICAIPSSVRIDAFQTNIAKARQGFQSVEEYNAVWRRNLGALRRWLHGFEYVVVDCPPSLAPQVRFFLNAADAYVLPSIPDRVSVRGARALCGRLGAIGFRTPGLGLLWTLYRNQVERHVRMVSLAEKRASVFEDLPKPFKTVVPNSAEIVRSLEADEADVRSFQAKYRSGAAVFEELCDEIVTRLRTAAPDQRPAKPTPKAPAAVQGPGHYHGTFILRAERAGRDAGDVAERVLGHLTVLDDARVNVSLNVDAEFAKGAPASVVRTITENARALKVKGHGFEDV